MQSFRLRLVGLTNGLTWLVLAGAIFLPGCQTGGQKRVSLEDAKKITAEIYQSRFETRLPPRTVDDLLQKLDSLSASNDQLLAGFVKAAEAPAPETSVKATLFSHYMRKAEAARLLGRYEESLAASKTARRVAPNGQARYHACFSSATALDELGQPQNALTIYEKGRTGRLNPVIGHAMRAIFLARAGDLAEAERSIASARAALANLSDRQRANSLFKRNYLMSAGTIHYLRGDYQAAEADLKNAVAVVDKDIERYTGPNGKPRPAYNRPIITGRSRIEGAYLLKTYAMRHLALSIMRQQRLAEAEAIAREALIIQVRVFGRYSGQAVEGLRALSHILAEQERLDDVQKLVAEQLHIYRKMGVNKDSATLAVTRRILADVLVVQGEYQKAQALYDRLSHDLTARPEIRAAVFSGNLNWAIPSIILGRAPEAEKLLDRIHARLTANSGKNNYPAAEALGLLAAARMARGDRDAALPAFQKALPILFNRSAQARQGSGTGSGRLYRRKFVAESYLELLANDWAAGRVLPGGRSLEQEAFKTASLIHYSSVQHALAASAARATITDPELAELARREQDALLSIQALNQLLSHNDIDTPMRKDLQQRIARLGASRLTIMTELARRYPSYAELIEPRHLSLAEAARQLQTGEALVMVHTTRNNTYVWAVPRSGRPVFAVTALTRTRAGQLTERLRRSLDPPQIQTLEDIPAFDTRLAHRLYKHVLAPVQTGWKEADRLTFVVNGPLATIPFTLLPMEDAPVADDRRLLFSGYAQVPWLVKRYAISSLPSVAALRTLRAAPKGPLAKRPFLGFGDPVFTRTLTVKTAEEKRSADLLSSRGLPFKRRNLLRGIQLSRKNFGLADLPPLPATADEIETVAASLKADFQRDVFLQAAANEARVKQLSNTRELAAYRVVSFATHGLLPGDLNGLTQPALALSHPQAAQVEGDGLLTAEEILGLKMQADWVVLSACNTAAAQNKGAEAMSGLGRAFFYAGTRALLVSSWPVHSDATRELMVDLFKRQAKNPDISRSKALQKTQVAMISGGVFKDDAGRAAFAYAHPIFWAPFSLMGDGGR